MSTLTNKFARNEADLISAAAQGSEVFHSVIFQKLAELNLDVGDRQAVMDMLTEEREKTAAPGGGFGIGHALALGSILAPAAIAGAKWLANRGSYDQGWQNLQMVAPDVIQHDPVRAKGIYDMLHATAPHIATNPVVASDLMRQMTAMPMLDLGSVKTMTEVGKNYGAIDENQHRTSDRMFQPLDQWQTRSNALNAITGGAIGMKTANVKLAVRHVAKDGTPCVFDWSTPAMKEAGITDAFTSGFSGHGTTMDQANSATQMEQMAGGQSLLPLDAVVRELIAKEMELSQREQILQQQEMQMQQAMQMQGQMGQMYQQQYGVDPSTGQPAGQPAEQDPNAGAPQDPNAGAPQDPNAGAPQDPNAGAPQDPNAVPQDPNAATMPDPNAGAPQDPNAGAPQDPNAVPGAPMAEGQPDPGAMPADGSESPPPVEGQDPNAGVMPVEGQDPTAAPVEGQDPNAGVMPVEGQDPTAGVMPVEGQDPNAVAPAPGAGGIPQAALLAAGGMSAPGQQMVAGPDGMHLTIPLPSLHIHIKTAETKVAADLLEAERQEALGTFNDLFSDIFRP